MAITVKNGASGDSGDSGEAENGDVSTSEAVELVISSW